jgi:hypothetical protein
VRNDRRTNLCLHLARAQTRRTMASRSSTGSHVTVCQHFTPSHVNQRSGFSRHYRERSKYDLADEVTAPVFDFAHRHARLGPVTERDQWTGITEI